MCYTGGPYCARPAYKRLQQAQNEYMDKPSERTSKARKRAQDDYDGTPEGQQVLLQRIEDTHVEGEKELLSLRMNRTHYMRKAQLAERNGKETPDFPVMNSTAFDDSPTKTLISMTPTGSRLYGTHHAESDYDYVMIYTDSSLTGHNKHKNMKQKLQGDDDVQRRSLDSFIISCNKGSANDLDVLYSSQWEYGDPKYAPLLKSIRPDYSQARGRFLAFMETYADSTDTKSTRHLFRVSLNGRKLLTHGRYNPTHTPQELKYLNAMAQKHKDSSADQKMTLAENFMMGGKNQAS